MPERKVLNRTHFRRRESHHSGPNDRSAYWQWYWATHANNGESVAVGGEGYDELRGAVHGFFSTHGINFAGGAFEQTPENFTLEKFDEHHWVVTQYETIK